MNCSKCNETIPDDSEFCPYCGNTIEKKKCCPSCEKELPEDSEFCPFCGKKIEKKSFCKLCGKEIPDDSEFCPFCGGKTVSEVQGQTIKKSEESISADMKSKPLRKDISNGVKVKSEKEEPLFNFTSQKETQKKSKRKTIIILSCVLGAVLISLAVIIPISVRNSTEKYTYPTSSYYYTAPKTTTRYYQTTEDYYSETKLSFEEWYSSKYSDEDQYDYEENTAQYYTTTTTTSPSTTATTATTTKATTQAKFNTLQYSGSGNKAIKKINFPEGNYYIICSYTGEGNFFANFYPSPSVSYGALIANFIGKGKTIYGYSGEAQNGYIEVECSGNWTVKIERCKKNDKGTTLSYSGSGKTGIKNINLPEGDYYITCSYTGEGNFFADFYPSTETSYGPLIANFIGSGSDTYAFSGSVTNGYINVDGKGNWTVKIKPC